MLLKVEGAGNDFVLGIGLWAERLRDDPALVERLCRRRSGIGGDGVLALFATGSDRVQVVYRNRDGSRATFCANGTRCAARAAVAALGAPARLVVSTDWCDLEVVVAGESVSLRIPPPAGEPRRQRLEACGRPWEGWLLEVGVPHLVVPCAAVEAVDVAGVGGELRAHPALAPEGANVSFVSLADDGRLHVRSFERGVEAETLCCGSGVVAAALVSLGHDRDRLECVPRSAVPLMVEALGQPPLCPSRLTGPARIVARVEPSAEWLADQSGPATIE